MDLVLPDVPLNTKHKKWDLGMGGQKLESNGVCSCVSLYATLFMQHMCITPVEHMQYKFKSILKCSTLYMPCVRFML